MKKVIKAVCSALCVTTMAMPAPALAGPDQETEDLVEDVVTQPDQLSNYQLAFVTGDYGMQFAITGPSQPFGAMVMFISDPNGRMVKDALVVTTIIDRDGRQMMQRASTRKGGYLIDTMQLPPGHYRMEAEIATNGHFLTDAFAFQKA